MYKVIHTTPISLRYCDDQIYRGRISHWLEGMSVLGLPISLGISLSQSAANIF